MRRVRSRPTRPAIAWSSPSGNSLTILTLDGGIVALIEGHTSVVSAVAYSADGSLIASARRRRGTRLGRYGRNHCWA